MIRTAILVLTLLLAVVTLAAESATPVKGKRTKALDFDDEVIEGMNKNPLDSVQHVGALDGDGKSRLYRKKPHFKKEIKRVLKDVRSQ